MQSRDGRSRTASASSRSSSMGTHHPAFQGRAGTMDRDVLESDIDEIDCMLRSLADDGPGSDLHVDEGFTGSRSLGGVHQIVDEALRIMRNNPCRDGAVTDTVLQFALRLMESSRDQVSPTEAVRRDEYIRPIEPISLSAFLTSTLFPVSPLSPVLTSSATARQCISYLALELYYVTQETKGLGRLLHQAREQIKYTQSQCAVLEMRCERAETQRDHLTNLMHKHERRLSAKGKACELDKDLEHVLLPVESQPSLTEPPRRLTSRTSTHSASRSTSPFRSPARMRAPDDQAAAPSEDEDDQYLLSEAHLLSIQASTRTISQTPLLDAVEWNDQCTPPVHDTQPATKVLDDAFMAAFSGPATHVAPPDTAQLDALLVSSTRVQPRAAVSLAATAPVPIGKPSTGGYAVTVYPQRTHGAKVCEYARAAHAMAAGIRQMSDRIHGGMSKGMPQARDSGCAEDGDPRVRPVSAPEKRTHVREQGVVGTSDVSLTALHPPTVCPHCHHSLMAPSDPQVTPRASNLAALQPPATVSMCDDDDPWYSDHDDDDSDLMVFPHVFVSPLGPSQHSPVRSRSRAPSSWSSSQDAAEDDTLVRLAAPWTCVQRQARRVARVVKDRVDAWLVV